MSAEAALLAELPQWAFGFVLVLARVGMTVMLLPGLGEAEIPAVIRAGLVLALVFLLLPGLAPMLPRQPDDIVVSASMLATELLVGLGLGWLARLVVLALPIAAQIVSYMLGLANVLQPDPVLGGQATALERLFAAAASVLVFVSGLYALPLMALAGSYRVVVPGASGTPVLVGDGVEAVINAVAESFALAMQLAAPFVLAGILWQVALGLLARLVPRLQVYFVAMPGQLLGGFVLLGLLATVLLGTWQAAVREGFSRLPGLG